MEDHAATQTNLLNLKNLKTLVFVDYPVTTNDSISKLLAALQLWALKISSVDWRGCWPHLCKPLAKREYCHGLLCWQLLGLHPNFSHFRHDINIPIVVASSQHLTCLQSVLTKSPWVFAKHEVAVAIPAVGSTDWACCMAQNNAPNDVSRLPHFSKSARHIDQIWVKVFPDHPWSIISCWFVFYMVQILLFWRPTPQHCFSNMFVH